MSEATTFLASTLPRLPFVDDYENLRNANFDPSEAIILTCNLHLGKIIFLEEPA